MAHEIFETEDDVMLAIVEGIPNSKPIFGLIVGIQEILNEGSELLLDVVPENLFWQLTQSLDLHGAFYYKVKPPSSNIHLKSYTSQQNQPQVPLYITLVSSTYCNSDPY